METFFGVLFFVSFLGLIIGLISPKLVIRWGRKRTRGQVLLIYGLATFVLLILYSVTVPPTIEKQEKVDVPSYTILNEDIRDVPLEAQVILNVLVSDKITEDGLRTLLDHLYTSTKKRRGFKYHDSPTSIYIYVFTSKERAESGRGQWIAMLQKGYHDVKPEISIKTWQIAQLSAKPEEKFGLSEDARKQIYSEIVKAEDRAVVEAERKYPLPDPLVMDPSQVVIVEKKQLERQAELRKALIEKYKNELAKKYGLTRQQLDEISIEGFIKGW